MFTDGDVITKVWMLLDIVHKASTAGPAYAHWVTEAQIELGKVVQDFNAANPKPEPELPLDPAPVSPINAPEDPTNE